MSSRPLRQILAFVLGAVVGAFLLAFFYLRVPAPILAMVGIGLVFLGWLVVLVTLPWNLHFRAKEVLAEMAQARSGGVQVDAAREAEAARMARRALRLSIGGHVVSGAIIAVGSWFYAEQLGYYFAALYLLSTFFRPAFEYHRYQRERLSQLSAEVRYPRNDVIRLAEEVRAAAGDLQYARRSVEELGQRLERLEEETTARDQATQRKIGAVARKFEETIDKLTDNQEIISGIKAFLRLVQGPGVATPAIAADDDAE
jgi:xanthosine utilization system XapX-like protein